MTSTGTDTEAVVTVSPTRWLSDAFRTGTGRVVGVGVGGLPAEPGAGGEAVVTGAEGVGTVVVRRTGGAVTDDPTPASPGTPAPPVGAEVVVGPDRGGVDDDEVVAGAAGGAGDGAGRAMTGGVVGRWAGTERSELTT
ncbi:MAG TPA: hypothetical protein VFW24_03710 [Acidimicrobiales bacterium]|nr:hypothetical protein [Acidimicrobiales bacterium]